MAICLDYQAVYTDRRQFRVSLRIQVLAAVVLLLVLAAKVWVRVQITDMGYQLANVRERTVELDMERRELELQRSILLRPYALRAAASKRLGLKDFTSDPVIKIK